MFLDETTIVLQIFSLSKTTLDPWTTFSENTRIYKKQLTTKCFSVTKISTIYKLIQRKKTSADMYIP